MSSSFRPHPERTVVGTDAPNKATGETGQASVEYALVILGAAIIATLLITWATSTGAIGSLFDHVLTLVKGKAA